MVFLKSQKFNGEILKFGNPEDELKSFYNNQNESFNYNLIKGGSIGLAEVLYERLFSQQIIFLI